MIGRVITTQLGRKLEITGMGAISRFGDYVVHLRSLDGESYGWTTAAAVGLGDPVCPVFRWSA